MTQKKRLLFFDSPLAESIRARLVEMKDDSHFKTESVNTANEAMYPDNQLPFVDKHMNYLQSHPAVDPEQYLANLRLISRVN